MFVLEGARERKVSPPKTKDLRAEREFWTKKFLKIETKNCHMGTYCQQIDKLRKRQNDKKHDPSLNANQCIMQLLGI